MKKVLVIRLGAIGDMIIVSPIFRLLKEEGYHVTLNAPKSAIKIVEHDPNIDAFIEHDSSMPADDTLNKHWEELSEGFDRVINLTESIEGTLVKSEYREEFNWPKERRHEECNVNFYDHTLKLSGFDITGLNGELHFTKPEAIECKQIRDKFNDNFIILWGMSGSSYHKTYPYTPYVAHEFLKRHPRAIIFTVGDQMSQILELDWEHARIKNRCGKWDIRKAMLMTKYADLVIGPDTGLLHASGCYDTPKIILQSANTHENISKYWENVVSLHADVPCSPCHQLHFTLASCPLDTQLVAPVCMTKLNPHAVLKNMEEIYQKWEAVNGTLYRASRPSIICAR